MIKRTVERRKQKRLEELRKICVVSSWQYLSEGKYPKDANTVIVSTDQNQVIPEFYDGINWYTAEGLKLGCNVIAWEKLPLPVGIPK